MARPGGLSCQIRSTLASVGRGRWGSVRKLASGRYQARYEIKGISRSAPTTFRTKGLAESFLATTRVDLERGTWVDPTGGEIALRVSHSVGAEQLEDTSPAQTPAFTDPYRRHRPMVERTIAWLIRRNGRKVRYRGVARNQIGLAHRCAAVNLRRLVNLGIRWHGNWTITS